MGVVTGGGGGGGPAAGSYLPAANTSGVTVDTTTYADSVKGGGAKLTTLVFPSDQGMFAAALSGDTHPRWLFSADPTDTIGMVMGDGTGDLVLGDAGLSYANGDLNLSASQLNPPNNIHCIDRVLLGAPAASAGQAPQLGQLSPKFTVTSGALSTVQLVSATGSQILTARDAETVTPCTFNPGAATTATVTVGLSPDNVTYSTLGVETEPVGTALDGTVHLLKVRVPAGWYLKLTVNAQAVLGLTTYY